MTDTPAADIEGFEWKEPPTDNRGRPSLRRSIIERLQARPGAWAIVAVRKDPSFSTALKKEGCETTTRKQADGMVEIYARWPETVVDDG
jgi:hypothetical protein